MFNEQSLYNDIVRVWGPHGAHAEVYKHICEKVGLALSDPEPEESVEDKIRRIYTETGGNKLQTIKRVREETLMGLLETKNLVERFT